MRFRISFPILVGVCLLHCAVDAPGATAQHKLALPVVFEENLGQAPAEVHFLARGREWSAAFEAGAVVLRHGPDKVRLAFVGASSQVLPQGRNPLPGRSGYFGGSDPDKWVTDARHYETVVYEEVYPGIDAVFHESNGRLEYDFHLSAGIDPSAIRLRFEGAKRLAVDVHGELAVTTQQGEFRQATPRAHQVIAGEKRPVESGYELFHGDEVGFALGDFDPASPLVIDPLVYATYFGGTGQISVDHLGVDGEGNVYLAGTGGGIDFPSTDGPGGGLYIAKFDPSRPGREGLRYSGFLSGVNGASAFDVDTSGRIYVAGGVSSSTLFAPTGNAFQTASTGGRDAFLTVLDLNEAESRVLVYSTLFGGTGEDAATVMARSDGSLIYLAGTGSEGLPVTEGAYQSASDSDRWIAVFDPSKNGGESLLYSTFFDADVKHLQPDAAGNIHLAGDCAFVRDVGTVCPLGTENAFKQECTAETNNRCYDVYYGVLQPAVTGSASLIYSTFLGGASFDNISSFTLDAQGRALLGGTTQSPDFPTTELPLGDQCSDHEPDCDSFSSTDAFVSLIDSAISGEDSLVFSQRLGGEGREFETVVFANSLSEILVAGSTDSDDFPTTLGAWQRECVIPDDRPRCSSLNLFVARFDPTAAKQESLQYASLLGGEDHEIFFSPWAAIDSQDRIYLSGRTRSFEFPTTSGAIERGFPSLPSDSNRSAFFVSRIDTRREGSDSLSYSTLLSGVDRFSDPARLVVSGERVHVVAETSTPDFPATPDAFDRTCGFGGLRPDGSCSTNVVLFIINPVAGPTLEPSESGLSFDYLIPDPAPVTFPMGVSTNDPSLVIRIVPETEGDWIRTVPEQVTGGGNFDVIFDPAALYVGNFEGLLRLQSDAPYIRRTLQISATVDAAPPGDIVGVLNGASFADQAVAPGQIVSIFGSNMGPVGGFAASETTHDNRILGVPGTSVIVEADRDYFATVLFGRHNQLNVIVPYQIAGERLVTFRVRTQRGESPGFGVTVAPTAPGLFTLSGTGQGPGAILNQDSTVNSADNPAERGSIVVLFGTGGGQTDPPGATGVLIEPPIPELLEEVRVLVDGQEAEVLFAGPAPGFAGLLQVNIRLPASVGTGAKSVVLIIGGIASPDQVTVAVQ